MIRRLRCHGLVLAIGLFLCGVVVTATDEKPQSDKPEEEAMEYIQVEVMGRLMTGIFAIGGETTGTMIFASNLGLELDFGEDKELAAEAKKLNGNSVIVTGRLEGRKGVEIPLRYIISVESLVVAPDKEPADE